MSNIKRIGILTSGGDAPGMNAAIRAATRSALENGLEVIGIKSGYHGLLKNEMVQLGARDVSYIINRGGTMLYTARSESFKTDEGVDKAVEILRQNNIDALICMGGDGTYRGAYEISKRGLPTIGIPCTIDNDVACTDATIGFDTAMNTVVDLVDKIRDTGESHARCNVVEVMGRHAGDIALQTALATGAVSAIVNEFEFDVESCVKRMIESRANGKRNFIIIVCEGKGSEYGEKLAALLSDQTKIEARFSRLGYIQRGGSPSLRDRVLATQMGCAAVQAIVDGNRGDVICLRGNSMVITEMKFAITLDNYVKNRYTKEEKDAIPANTMFEIKKIVAEREAYKSYLYETASRISL